MHVTQFDPGGGGEAGNIGNQRAAAVSVQIGAIAIGGAHFPNAG